MSYRKDLEGFIKFKKDYQFKQLEIEKKKDGKLYCLGELLKDGNNYVGETTKWINVGYGLYGMYPKLLSNLFPYEFRFKGYRLNSIESFFQGIKFPNKRLQKKIFKYSGKEAVVLQKTSDYDWRQSGIIYWRGRPIHRDSLEYNMLLTELYVSAIQNPFYRNAIKSAYAPIIHAMGEENTSDTVFTRYEFEFMLNCLHDYLNSNN